MAETPDEPDPPSPPYEPAFQIGVYKLAWWAFLGLISWGLIFWAITAMTPKETCLG